MLAKIIASILVGLTLFILVETCSVLSQVDPVLTGLNTANKEMAWINGLVGKYPASRWDNWSSPSTDRRNPIG